MVDNFTFLGPGDLHAHVSLDVTWHASGDKRRLTPHSSDPADPMNFEARFRFATATGTFAATEHGFSIRHARGSSQGLFAEMGREKNGSFLHDDDDVASVPDDD